MCKNKLHKKISIFLPRTKLKQMLGLILFIVVQQSVSAQGLIMLEQEVNTQATVVATEQIILKPIAARLRSAANAAHEPLTVFITKHKTNPIKII